MSAHLLPIDRKCQRCRTARATVELFNTWNASNGYFCTPCGRAALRRLLAQEATHYERAAVGGEGL